MMPLSLVPVPKSAKKNMRNVKVLDRNVVKVTNLNPNAHNTSTFTKLPLPLLPTTPTPPTKNFLVKFTFDYLKPPPQSPRIILFHREF